MFAGFILFTGCGGTNPSNPSSQSSDFIAIDPYSGGISGVVYGSGSAPVSGAYVETLERQTVSQGSGAYLLYPLAAGDHRVLVRAINYGPSIKEQVRVTAGRVTENIDFYLNDPQFASASKDFVVLSVQPFYGTDGDEIEVVAKGLGTVVGRVTIGGKDAGIMDWNSGNNGTVKIKLPTEVESGAVKIIIDGESSHESVPVQFTARPVATEAKPSAAKPGQKIALIGRNFFPVTAFNKVSLNGLRCEVLPDSTIHQLNIIVPDKAETGTFDIKVETESFSLDGISYATLSMSPELVWLSPQRSIPGVTLTLYATHMGYDSSAVKVNIGNKKVVSGAEILTFSNNKLTFAAPSNAIVPAGTSIDISLTINKVQTASLTYTAYDIAQANLNQYGISELTTANFGASKTVRLARLKSNDRLAFVSTLSSDGTTSLDEPYSYNVTCTLGGNTSPMPTNIVKSVKAFGGPSRSLETVRLNSSADESARTRGGIRAMAAVYPATATFYVANLAANDPTNYLNDIEASATFKATGTKCLVYLDDAANNGITQVETEKIAAWFDEIYAFMGTSFSVLAPPEGNIDAQSQIILFVTPKLKNGLTGSLRKLAYFNPRDKNLGVPNSAGTEILFLNDQAVLSEPDNLKSDLARELQHMMYFNQKKAEAANWIDEGLSGVAEDIASCGYKQGFSFAKERVSSYLSQPYQISLNHWPTTQSQVSPANFGLSYLFGLYLYERCQGFQTLKTLHTYRTGSVTGFADITANVLPTAVGGAVGLIDFFNQFALAMYCDNLQSTFITNPYYKFQTVTLQGIHHIVLDETPLVRQSLTLKGFSCDVVEYVGGNDGDVEFIVNSPPTAGTFKTWVIYLPN